MAKPRALILRAPGTNCDEETAFAFEKAGAQAEAVHVNRLLKEPDCIKQFQILCVPGGFSFGDDIGAGKVLGMQLQTSLADVLQEFKSEDKLILGICNGFQVLLKTGLLLGGDAESSPATLTWNDCGRFHDSWVHLATDDQLCVFLRGIDRLELPIAHAEGKFVGRDQSILDVLQDQHRLAIRYCKPSGPNGYVPFPFNPNGSERDVAGICDETGRVFGLMPHPERNIDPTHHPNWTRSGLKEFGDGLLVFKNAVEYFV